MIPIPQRGECIMAAQAERKKTIMLFSDFFHPAAKKERWSDLHHFQGINQSHGRHEQYSPSFPSQLGGHSMTYKSFHQRRKEENEKTTNLHEESKERCQSRKGFGKHEKKQQSERNAELLNDGCVMRTKKHNQ